MSYQVADSARDPAKGGFDPPPPHRTIAARATRTPGGGGAGGGAQRRRAASQRAGAELPRARRPNVAFFVAPVSARRSATSVSSRRSAASSPSSPAARGGIDASVSTRRSSPPTCARRFEPPRRLARDTRAALAGRLVDGRRAVSRSRDGLQPRRRACSASTPSCSSTARPDGLRYSSSAASRARGRASVKTPARTSSAEYALRRRAAPARASTASRRHARCSTRCRRRRRCPPSWASRPRGHGALRLRRATARKRSAAAPRQRRGACAHAAPAARRRAPTSTSPPTPATRALTLVGAFCRFVPSKVLLYLYEGDHYAQSCSGKSTIVCATSCACCSRTCRAISLLCAERRRRWMTATNRRRRRHRRSRVAADVAAELNEPPLPRETDSTETGASPVRPGGRGSPARRDLRRLVASSAGELPPTATPSASARLDYASLLRAGGVAPDGTSPRSAWPISDSAAARAIVRRMAPTACVQAVSRAARARWQRSRDRVELLGIADAPAAMVVVAAHRPEDSSRACWIAHASACANSQPQRIEALDVVVVNASRRRSSSPRRHRPTVRVGADRAVQRLAHSRRVTVVSGAGLILSSTPAARGRMFTGMRLKRRRMHAISRRRRRKRCCVPRCRRRWSSTRGIRGPRRPRAAPS